MAAKQNKKRYSAEESTEWLRNRLEMMSISSLDELAKLTGIDKGTISRYFHQERRPSIDMIGPLCQTLKVAPENLLIALGALDRKPK